jgi:hypothetical protein
MKIFFEAARARTENAPQTAGRTPFGRRSGILSIFIKMKKTANYFAKTP